MSHETYSSTKIYKIVICGDGYTGKTSLRRRFFGESFKSNYAMTLAADFVVKKHSMNQIEYVLQLWDLAGQPSYQSVRNTYYRNASGLVLVFDITNRESFVNIPKWLNEFQSSNSGKNANEIPAILIGNKMDLRDKIPNLSQPKLDGEEYVKTLSNWSKFDIPYLETSAMTGENVNLAFEELIKMLDS